MKRLLAVLFFLSSPALAWDVDTMNNTIDNTNFMVNDGCSGTLVDAKKSYVLTADHCVMTQYRTVEKDVVDPKTGEVEKKRFQVVEPGTVSQLFYKGSALAQTNKYVYKVVEADKDFDLALLEVQAPLPNQDAKLACHDLMRGDVVYAVGNSFGQLYSTVTKGIVSSITRSYRDMEIAGQLGDPTDNGEHGLTQHSAPIAPGNSGGALYNDAGEFVGVNVRGASMLGGFSFAVPYVDVRAFLAKHDVAPKCS